ADGGQFVERVRRIQPLRVDGRVRRGHFVGDGVVVEDDDVHAELIREGDLRDGADATVRRHEDSGTTFAEPLHGAEVQPVAFAEAVGDVVDGLCAEWPKPQLQHSNGGHAIDVEVAEQGNGLAAGDGTAQPFDRLVHARQLKRVVVRGEVWFIEEVGLGSSGDATRGKYGRDNWWKFCDAVLARVRVPQAPARAEFYGGGRHRLRRA